MKALEQKVAAMQISGSGSHRGRDDSFQQLTVIGFDSQVSLEHRLVAMQAFMETHFSTVDARHAVIHSGSWKEKGKHRKMTGVGLIDVGCPDL